MNGPVRIGAVVIAAVGATAAALALPAESRIAELAARCPTGTIRATIGGKRVCFREGQACDDRLAARYRRYGLVCAGVRGLQVPWASLRKRPPIRLDVAAGSPCPVAPLTGDITGLGLTGRETLWGHGPAYPMLDGDAAAGAVLSFPWPPPAAFGPDWSGNKVLWILDRRVRKGRILVRGRQLDGPNEVRFQNGWPGFTAAERIRPSRELRIEGGFTQNPSWTRVRAAGCYAYQVDGRTFSYLLTFEARPLD